MWIFYKLQVFLSPEYKNMSNTLTKMENLAVLESFRWDFSWISSIFTIFDLNPCLRWARFVLLWINLLQFPQIWCWLASFVGALVFWEHKLDEIIVICCQTIHFWPENRNCNEVSINLWNSHEKYFDLIANQVDRTPLLQSNDNWTQHKPSMY